MGGFLSRATRRGTLAQVRHVTPVHPAAATGLTAAVYRQTEDDFGMLAPPISLHSPAPEVMAAAWMILRESLLSSGVASRAVKETVATAVSAANRCPYCVDVHGTALRGLVRGRDPVDIGAGRGASARDPELRAAAAWAAAAATSGGAVRSRPPGTAGYGDELVAVAAVFHYLNRMVSVFLDESPIPPRVPAALRGGLQQVFGRVMAPITRRHVRPGAALELLPAAPGDGRVAAVFAASTPRLADAFARAGRAVEEAGKRSVPPAVRTLVLDRLAAWDGTPPGLSSAWTDADVARLDPRDRPAGRLALLTAIAAYQVGPGVIERFRQEQPEDRPLVELTAWAALAAARRVAAWSSSTTT
ncbi:carboxymuconolactone decarboxylase family protein [Dactylosporangium sp. NPDC051485]|uniref:carboxymuconolactone decarboxylase family protein n=1 Tax=Dactylosporangium sp. NPDC051485 TaxID=3154846 RepID=UPI003417AF85